MARSPRRRPAKRAVVPTTVLSRMHEQCRAGMHLWCPGTVGSKQQSCLCGCHAGRPTTVAAYISKYSTKGTGDFGPTRLAVT
jgi:hypothetical protein